MRFRADVVHCVRYTVVDDAESVEEFREMIDETGPDDEAWVEESVDEDVWSIEEVVS